MDSLIHPDSVLKLDSYAFWFHNLKNYNKTWNLHLLQVFSVPVQYAIKQTSSYVSVHFLNQNPEQNLSVCEAGVKHTLREDCDSRCEITC